MEGQQGTRLRSLYHEGIIVSIPALKPSRRDELEQLLSIFDQSNRTKDMHIMNIKLEDYPNRLRPVLQRLKKAAQNQEVRSVMNIEDEFLRDLEEYEERVEEAQLRAEEAQLRAEEAQRQNEEAQHRAEEAQRQNEKAQHMAEEAKRRAEEAQRQNEEAQRENEKAIILMLQSGISKQTISEALGKSLKEIEEIEILSQDTPPNS